MRSSSLFALAAAVGSAVACDSCYGPSSEVVHERLVRRIQPESQDSTVDPRAPLEWGQLNFMHTVCYTQSYMYLCFHLLFYGSEADISRLILMVGLKVISRSRIMVLMYADLPPLPPYSVDHFHENSTFEEPLLTYTQVG